MLSHHNNYYHQNCNTITYHAGIFVAQNVHLCPGDNFPKMCSTNYSYLQWNVYFPRAREWHGILVPRYGSNNYTVRSTRCDIILNSDPGVLPIYYFNTATPLCHQRYQWSSDILHWIQLFF